MHMVRSGNLHGVVGQFFPEPQFPVQGPVSGRQSHWGDEKQQGLKVQLLKKPSTRSGKADSSWSYFQPVSLCCMLHERIGKEQFI